MSDELSLAEVNKIMNSGRQTAAQKAEQWPPPDEKLLIEEAISNRKGRVTLNGQEFKIQYRHGKALVQPVYGFAPCGWFSL